MFECAPSNSCCLRLDAVGVREAEPPSCLCGAPVLAQFAGTPPLTVLSYVAGFGWDACEKGNWYETLKSQIP